MKFGAALEAMRQGFCVRRDAWPRWRYIRLDLFNGGACFMRSPSDKFAPWAVWIPAPLAMLGDDWIVGRKYPQAGIDPAGLRELRKE